jgi:di/tricarboxylate transporter
MPLALLNMSPSGWFAILVTVVVFACLQFRRGAPSDLLFLGALVAVTVAGVISPGQALEGFANEAVVTIGALLVVAAGLRWTGVLDQLGNRLLGTARTVQSATVRLALALVACSAVVINTAVVAMFVPVVLDWCRRRGVSPSRLLIPVSYLAILGGTCTLIGTSTNILVNGLLKAAYQEAATVESGDLHYSPEFREELRPMSLLEIGRIGLPCAVLGSLYLLLIGRHLLPDRTELIEQLDEQRREYLIEMLVQPECRLIGTSVEAAGLRHLRGLFLVEIDREGEVITPVAPSDVIRAGDRLIFTGVVTTIVDLEKIPGLVPAADVTYEFHPHQRQMRHLSETVLSATSPLIGTTVRAANFRQRYNAAVVAVHRAGARLSTKIGDIVLQAGDTLLLQTRTGFSARFRNSADFYLVADVEGSEARRHHRARLAATLMLVLIAWLMATSWIAPSGPLGGFSSTAVAGVTVAGLVILGRCLPIAEARSVIDLQVLLTIVGALGLGKALKESGAADALAGAMVNMVGGENPYLLLIVLYLLTVVFTETISNTAVAVMMFRFGVAMAAIGGYSPRPFVMAIVIAASLSFVTPIGYQTNLMVMGPGGYRPRDYIRAGWPLSLMMGVITMLLIPRIWPFEL